MADLVDHQGKVQVHVWIRLLQWSLSREGSAGRSGGDVVLLRDHEVSVSSLCGIGRRICEGLCVQHRGTSDSSKLALFVRRPFPPTSRENRDDRLDTNSKSIGMNPETPHPEPPPPAEPVDVSQADSFCAGCHLAQIQNSKFWINCDACGLWYHDICEGLTEPYNEDTYICQKCRKKRYSHVV